MQAVVSAILAAGCPFLPHSPRWLRHVGRRAEADAAWERRGVSAADAEKTEETAERERERVQRGSVWEEASAMWRKDVRKRTALGVFVMGMSNVNGLLSAFVARFPRADNLFMNRRLVLTECST